MAKVVFLQNLEFEFYGIMCIAGALKQNNHQCNVLVGADNDLLKGISKIKPDLIAFSCMAPQYVWIADMARKIKVKYPSIPIVAGGPYPTLCPDEVILNHHIDIVCRGEGEYAMLELAECIDRGREITEIKGLWLRKDGEIFKNVLRPQADVNELPWSDREIYSEYPFAHRDPRAYFLVSRGCIHSCAYCSASVLNKKLYDDHEIQPMPVRTRNVTNVISEIISAFIFYRYKKYDKKNVFFCDSTLLINKEWAVYFLSEYRKKISIPFACNVTADLIDEEITALLKQANCTNVLFGVETGNEKLRISVLNKRITNAQIEKAAGLFRKYKLYFTTSNMYCLPGETLSDAFETIRINQRIKPTRAANLLYLPLPGTELGDYSFIKGYVLKNKTSPYRSIIRQKDNKKIENLGKLAHILISKPSFFPLIKFLIKFPRNYLFDNIYAYHYLGAPLYSLIPFLRVPLLITKILFGSYKRMYNRRYGYKFHI